MSEDELEGWREKIDQLDNEIITLLSERVLIAKDVMAWKKKHQKPLLDSKREQEIFEMLTNKAEALGVNPQMIHDLYELILKYSKEL